MTISEYFHLKKAQAELDFANISVITDMPLFIDPTPLAKRQDSLSADCSALLNTYFGHLTECIRCGHDKDALDLLMWLHEPNETRLGFSSGIPQGAGIGWKQAEQIFQALKKSEAVTTGFISSLGECELMVKGLGADKISDLTTNIIRKELYIFSRFWTLEPKLSLQIAPGQGDCFVG